MKDINDDLRKIDELLIRFDMISFKETHAVAYDAILTYLSTKRKEVSELQERFEQEQQRADCLYDENCKHQERIDKLSDYNTDLCDLVFALKKENNYINNLELRLEVKEKQLKLATKKYLELKKEIARLLGD